MIDAAALPLVGCTRVRPWDIVSIAVENFPWLSGLAKGCQARPRPSCSRPDGQSIRHWVREAWWTNEGVSCDYRESLEPDDG